MSPPIDRTAAQGDISVSEVTYGSGERMPRHAHPELSLTLVLSGGLEEAVERRATEAGPLSIGIKPCGVEHANRFDARGTRTICVKIGATWLSAFGPVLPEIREWQWLQGGSAVPQFLAMLAALRESRSPDVWIEPAVVDLVADLRRDDRLRASLAPLWLSRVRARLLDDVQGGVQAAALAEDAGVHPVSLARAFRRHYGESMSACIRRARIQAAARALQRDDVSIADAAAIAGLADQSHLTRLCRAETGVTPAALRRLQQADAS